MWWKIGILVDVGLGCRGGYEVVVDLYGGSGYDECWVCE